MYVPSLRRTRRISSAQRTDAVSGTDFTFDDLRSFAGIVPQYSWECLGEMDLVAPMNSKVAAYPYARDHNFGPYGIWHNHRCSDDALAEDAGRWYAGWAGVEKPRDLRVVSDTIVNVQTGTGNRIEFWDGYGTPLRSKGKVRTYIDVGRLARGN